MFSRRQSAGLEMIAPDSARRAFDAVAAAQTARTIEELEASAGSALREFGFDVVVAVEIYRQAGEQAIFPVFGDTRAPPILDYLSKGHAAHCPVIRSASSDPVLWRELKRRPLAPQQRRVLNDLGDFAMHDGHVVAVQRRGRRPIAVSLAGSRIALDGPDERAAVHLLSTHYGLIGAHLTDAASAARQRLTARQLEMLKWVRDGKSSADIGDILGLSARTVDQHLVNACERLGVRTRVQAVIEAFLSGELEL